MGSDEEDEEMMTMDESPSSPAASPPRSPLVIVNDTTTNDTTTSTCTSNDDDANEIVMITMMNMLKTLENDEQLLIENVHINYDNTKEMMMTAAPESPDTTEMATTILEEEGEEDIILDTIKEEDDSMLNTTKGEDDSLLDTTKEDEDTVLDTTKDEEDEDTVLDTAKDEELEDLEDGELEDDDDEPVVLKVAKPAPIVPAVVTIKASSDSSKDRSSKSSKSADKKDKDKDRNGRRSSNDKKRGHHHHNTKSSIEDVSKSKKSKLEPPSNMNMMMMSEDDDDCYLFVRGGSHSPNHAAGNDYPANYHPDDQAYPPGSRPPPNLFDIVLDEDGMDSTGEDVRGKHSAGNAVSGGRRGRSPPGNRRRRVDENVNSGNSRPPRGGQTKSGRKEPSSLGDKLINAAAKSDTVCSYYMQGKCQKSHDDCTFSHNAVPPRKMELCKFWMMECCAKKEKCLYLHNDFPCKYYHTGLICKMGEKCKFSHKPLNEVTKAVLLKHIETAPKEILGDFPRLNRNGALTLINKMEARIIGNNLEREKKEKAKQRAKDKEGNEKEQAEHPRRSRWEQPTHDDNEKLQELMEEAGIGGFYKETLEGVGEEQQPAHFKNSNSNAHTPMLSQHHNQHQQPRMPLLQHPPPPTNRFQPHHIVHNPALANVLANLNIPSSTIDVSSQQQQQQQQPTVKQEVMPMNGTMTSPNRPNLSLPKLTPPPAIKEEENALQIDVNKDTKEPMMTDPPEHLPPMQRELFLRIQQQQMKHDTKKKSPSDDEHDDDDRGWYSSDEEEEKKETAKKKQELDFSSVLSAIRQTAAASSSSVPAPIPAPVPVPKNELLRGDTDLRSLNTSTNSSRPQQSLFGDTDFRLPSHRPEFKDIDLRLSNSAAPGSSNKSTSSPPPLMFKGLPSGPAKEIDASLKSHPPMEWVVHLVAGLGKPDYSYIRHTMQPSQILMDPRLGPRPSGGSLGLLEMSAPASPPPQQQQQQVLAPPATIPGGDVIVDPRVNRRNQLQQQQQPPQLQGMLPGQGLLGEHPRFPSRDPRGPSGIMQTPPPNWPTGLPPPDIAQQALAAQFIAAQQLGLPLFPFPSAPSGGGNLPFGQDYSNMPTQRHRGPQPLFRQMNQGQGARNHNRGSSSWERYSQGGNNQHHQHHLGGLSPPL